MPTPAQSRHEALPYTGVGQFVSACRTVTDEALAGERRVMIMAPESRLAELRKAMDGQADDATFVATDVHGRNPARISALLESFGSGGDGRPSVAVADWGIPARSSAVTAEIELAEAVLNLLVLRMTSFDVVCLYDSDTVGDTVLSGMRSSHPFLRGLDDNADYDPELATALYAGELPGAPEPVTILDVGPAELSAARHAVRAFAETRGLDEQRADDFVLAANEIMTNSIRHGGGRGRMSMWELEDSLVCQVADTGHITDPLIGRFSPLPSAGSGRGIWLANQVCDLVQVRSSPTGTVVRLFIDRSDGQR